MAQSQLIPWGLTKCWVRNKDYGSIIDIPKVFNSQSCKKKGKNIKNQ